MHADTAQRPPSTSRSLLDQAVQSMKSWPAGECELFIASITTKKSGAQIAAEFGISESDYENRRKEILRRFMRASSTDKFAAKTN